MIIKKLLEFSKNCDFITYEFENIPANSLKLLEDNKNIYPNINTLKVSQDRYLEKFINSLGIRTSEYKKIRTLSDVEIFLKNNSRKGIIKTRKLDMI